MNEMNVIFHTKGQIEDQQRQAITKLSSDPRISLSIVLERPSGRRSETRLGEFIRLWRRFGGFTPIFILQRLLHHIREPDENEALNINVPMCVVDNVHSDRAKDWIREQDPHLGVVYGHKILRPDVYNIPEYGTLGVHWGTVPEYRGKHCVFWEMYNGEGSTSVTIQKIDEGLDTGEIVLQKPVDIAPDDSLSSVRTRVYEESVEALHEGVIEYYNYGNDVSTITQPASGGLYSDPKLRHRLLFRLKRGSKHLLWKLKQSI